MMGRQMDARMEGRTMGKAGRLRGRVMEGRGEGRIGTKGEIGAGVRSTKFLSQGQRLQEDRGLPGLFFCSTLYGCLCVRLPSFIRTRHVWLFAFLRRLIYSVCIHAAETHFSSYYKVLFRLLIFHGNVQLESAIVGPCTGYGAVFARRRIVRFL